MMAFLRRVLSSISVWWDRHLGRTSEEAIPVVEVSRDPGLTCPECGTRMKVTIADLLSVGAVACPSCHLVLEVDTDRSKGALQALSTLVNSHQQASAYIDEQGRLGRPTS
jgi:transcription elongation factor Elf1